MAQWFNRLKLFLLKVLGAKAYSVALSIEDTEKSIVKASLVIHRHANDEAMRAMVSVLRAQQTRSLYALSSFNGTLENLHKLQGHLQAIDGLLLYLKDVSEMSSKDIRSLVSQHEEPKKSKVINLSPGSRRQDTVI